MGIEYILPDKYIEFLRTQKEVCNNGSSSQFVDIYFSDGLLLMNVEILACSKFYFRNERLKLENIERIIVKAKEN